MNAWEATWNQARRTVAGAARDAADARYLFAALGLDGKCPPYTTLDPAPAPGKNMQRTGGWSDFE
jgi:hypothetical protein